ncbi:DUF6518 family protein [Allonocardiopsis opalescens]|nr:DUF6518 family protein [Allonocardiopsis opalescens]
MRADSRPPGSHRTWPAPLAIALGAGAAIGCLTSYAQGLLPDGLAPLANSAGSWSAIAFLLGTLSRHAWVCALIGVLSLAAMVVGYDIGSILRGYQPAMGMTLFWLAAAVVAGPPLGLGGHALRTRSRLTPAAVGAMSGVLIGEGGYGLSFIAATTPPAYWWCSIAAGTALLVWAIARRFPDLRSATAATGVTALVAIAFVAVYSLNLIGLFT